MSGSVEQNRPQDGGPEREVPPERPALPPPAHHAVAPAAPGFIDRFISWIELRPLWSGGSAFLFLVGAHIAFMNFAGAMDGVFVGASAFFASMEGLADASALLADSFQFVLRCTCM
jgi:hypothetical protein